MRIIRQKTLTRRRLNDLKKEDLIEMIRKTILTAFVAVGLAFGGTAALAGEDGAGVTDYAFSFEGPFGKFDQAQLQRGLQVYTQVCAACHGLRQVAFRTLGDEGGPEMEAAQIKAYALDFEVFDPELDDTRPAKPFDKFPKGSFDGAPDLSVMAKARAGFHGPYGLGLNQFFKGMGGSEYIASFLAGYTGEEKEEAGAVIYENPIFTGGFTAMPPPLEDGAVEYIDGSPNTVDAMAQDVAAFLMWTAEPKMMARKKTGLVTVLFLAFLATLLYLTNKKLWAPVKRKT
jgi:ubiquinol-cytochrome c reductase cytochrome c1 subunit